jgi:hypothetical protein
MHFGIFQHRLKTDPQFRRQFFDDPVGVFRREGLYLSPEQERSLREAVAKFKTSAPSFRQQSKLPLIYVDPY